MTDQKQNLSVDLYEKPVTFKTTSGEITLTINHVKKFVLKGDAQKLAVNDAVAFIQLCRYNELNPFVGDAFLIVYGDTPQMVVGKQAFLKRAEEWPSYEGFKAGLVLMPPGWMDKLKETGELPKPIYTEGMITFGLDLVGGWAEVYKKGSRFPVRIEVPLSEYLGRTKSGDVTKQWKDRPGTMIRKVAVSQGLREAFPNRYHGIYSQDEIAGAEDVDPTPKEPPIDIKPISKTETTEGKGETTGAGTETTEGKGETTGAGDEASTRRARRQTTELDGKEIKTCGISGPHIKAIQDAEKKSPKLVKVVDDYLAGVGANDLTFLRKEEAKELLGMIMEQMSPTEISGESTETTGGEEEPPPWDPESGSQSTISPEPDQGQGPERKGGETTGKGENGSLFKGPTEDKKGKEETIPCPDRGKFAVEFSFCKNQCPKYATRTCDHFREDL